MNYTYFEEVLVLFSSRFKGILMVSDWLSSLTLSEPITAGYRNTFKALKQVCSKSDFKII